MKKVPSYPKITAKTSITVTQTQNININSPKGIALKKGFKSDSKKPKTPTNLIKNQSGVSLLRNDSKKVFEPIRKSSKKELKESVNQKTLKSTKSQKQLALLSEKLKKLQQKINKIRQKERTEKNSSASHRSFSRNRENSNIAKKQSVSSRKQLDVVKKYQIIKAESQKNLKKSRGDKLQLQMPTKAKHKKKTEGSLQNKGPETKQKHAEQILHQIVTQVPNSHPPKYANGGQKSLANGHYAITPSSQSDQQAEKEQNQPYYIGKAFRSLSKPSLYNIREHLVQSLQTLQFLQNIKKPSLKQIEKKAVALAASKFPSTIVLDLDQTLIHCNESLSIPHDVKLSIKFPTGEKIDAGVNIRPHAKHFIQELAKICEVVVFTASHECYATVVLDYLDPKKQYISHRLFREHCWQTEEGVYIKDLRVLRDRSLDSMLLVDNAAYSYYFQLENGVPIIPYYDDKQDTELLTLLSYIKESLATVDRDSCTLRHVNNGYFRLNEYFQYEDTKPLVERLYGVQLQSSNI